VTGLETTVKRGEKGDLDVRGLGFKVVEKKWIKKKVAVISVGSGSKDGYGPPRV